MLHDLYKAADELLESRREQDPGQGQEADEFVEKQVLGVLFFFILLLTVQALFSTIHDNKPPTSRRVTSIKAKTRYFV